MTIKLIEFEEKLALIDDEAPSQKPLFIDFGQKSLTYRLEHGGGIKQALAKACGVKSGFRPTVVDCTAGLGKDAFILASLGCKVLMIEKHPLIGKLLADGLQRGLNDPQTKTHCENLSLQLGDAEALLAKLLERPHTIYLDPMFPPRTKSAKVKKEMQLLQKLIGEFEDASTLLKYALNYAENRVVVKRPSSAPPLDDISPTYQISGKTNRFDVYLTFIL